jgi:hypothetical protein
MKKILVLLITAAFAIGSIGCGGTKAAAKSDSTAQKPAKKSLTKAKGNRMEMAEEDE